MQNLARSKFWEFFTKYFWTLHRVKIIILETCLMIYRPVIPPVENPPGGIYVLGRNTSIWGIGEEWTPSWGINKYPLIAQDVLLTGVLWPRVLMLHYDPRVVAHYHRTQCPPKWTLSLKDNIFGSEAWTKMEMHALPAERKNFLKNLALGT